MGFIYFIRPKKNWLQECQIFIDLCQEYNLPVYLERSRSGNGGHIWMLFENPYSAKKSRKIFLIILQQSQIVSLLDKSVSFDRLFPNQDYLSGKGFGNLIALPFHKKSFINGNSSFIDKDSGKPYTDQWGYLKEVRKVSGSKLDEIYNEFSSDDQKILVFIKGVNSKEINISNKVEVILENNIHIAKQNIDIKLINYLKDELNFFNSEYIIKKKLGKSTWKTERYFKLYSEEENEFILPRGIIGQLLRFCKQNKISYNFIDNREKLDEISLKFTGVLKDYQKNVIKACYKKDLGIIVSPPGSGKTVIGLKLISDKKQPAIIIVHRKQIADQWIERVETFLGIPKQEIGFIGSGKFKLGKQITIALFQSLAKKVDNEKFDYIYNSFGLILIDECHHIPAKSFRNILSKFSTYYQYGLTATPYRKNNDTKLIFIYLGETICEVKLDNIEPNKVARIIVEKSDFNIPYNSKTDQFEELSKILVHDTSRNELILKDIYSVLNSGKKAIIITERKEHITVLYNYLKLNYEVITISGEDKDKSRQAKWNLINKGDFQVIITTGQFFGEGSDIQNVSTLFLVYPFSFKGKLIQYIGRVQRSVAP